MSIWETLVVALACTAFGLVICILIAFDLPNHPPRRRRRP